MTLPFLIAEIGINHNGDLSMAKKLIKICKSAGFDSVKFQKRDINLVYTEEFLNEHRESPWGKTQRDQKKGLEFNESDYLKIGEYCKKINIEWFASAWDLNSLNFLKKFNLKFNKIASPMIVDSNFLQEVSLLKKHTFISTGMSSEKDIDNAVEIFKKNNCSFELMHCVSTYPMSPEDANLNTIKALKKKYKCNVGYSGHENGLAISMAAASMNISSLERHVTLDRTMYGSDQSASLEPSGIRGLVEGVKKVVSAMGEEKLGYISDEEKKIADKLRQHIRVKN